MPLQRQTRLRVSAQRVLCIEPPPPLPAEESITFSLPDEILMEIFTHLAPKDFSNHFVEYAQYLPLTLVCKRWRRIYEPFLYQILDLAFRKCQNTYRARRLLENLENRPNLCGNARAVRIILSNPNWHVCNSIARVVAHCKAIGKVSLQTEDNIPDHASLLFDAIQNLPRLETLHLSVMSLQTVLGRFDLPSLKTLYLSRCSSNLGASWLWDVPVNQQDLDQILPPSRYRTGKVVSLTLSNLMTPF